MRDGKARVLNKQQAEVLFKVTAAGKLGLRDFTMITLSYGLGLRVGEIASLDVGDVVNDKYELKDELVLKRKNTKNKKSRIAYLTSTKVRDALKAWIASLITEGDPSPSLDMTLFKSMKGNRMSPNALQQLFARLYKAAGFSGCKSHSGRRTFATRIIQNGGDVKSLKTMLGHASITMTEQYVEDMPEILASMTARAL